MYHKLWRDSYSAPDIFGFLLQLSWKSINTYSVKNSNKLLLSASDKNIQRGFDNHVRNYKRMKAAYGMLAFIRWTIEYKSREIMLQFRNLWLVHSWKLISNSGCQTKERI